MITKRTPAPTRRRSIRGLTGYGHSAYANVSEGGASWPGFAEKGLAAAVKKTWSPVRSEIARDIDCKGSSELDGYAFLEKGYVLYKMTDVLTQITGRSARILRFDSAEKLLPAWERLTSEGKLVITRTVNFGQSMPDGMPPYGLKAAHEYEITGVRGGHVILTGSNQPDPIPVKEVGNLFEKLTVTLEWPSAPRELPHVGPEPGQWPPRLADVSIQPGPAGLCRVT